VGLGLFRCQFGLEALLRSKPRPSAHTAGSDACPNDAGPNDPEPNAGADDPITHSTIPTSPDSVLGKLLELV